MLFLMLLQAAAAQPAAKPEAALRAHVDARDVTLGGSENSTAGGKDDDEDSRKDVKPSKKPGLVDVHAVAADVKTIDPVRSKTKARPKG